VPGRFEAAIVQNGALAIQLVKMPFRRFVGVRFGAGYGHSEPCNLACCPVLNWRERPLPRAPPSMGRGVAVVYGVVTWAVCGRVVRVLPRVPEHKRRR